MQEPASPVGTASAPVRSGLLDYCQSPGKYQVGLRQPQVLFASVREILQIAIGREDVSEGAGDGVALRDAARFFVRTALLFPGADHYALLGVERTADNAELKDRYRLMMRLLHPDFSGPSAGSWPADSAVRVNRAYDALSSAVQRRLYDESLVIPVLGSGNSASPEPARARPVVVRSDADTRQSHFKILAAVCALAGVGLVAMIISATSSPESVHLVQRAPVQTAASVTAARAPELTPAPAPLASTVSRLQEALAQLSPTVPAGLPKTSEVPPARPTPLPPPKRVETSAAAPVIEPQPRLVPSGQVSQRPVESRTTSASALAAATELKPEVLLAAAPVSAPVPVPALVPPAAPVMATAPPAPAAPAAKLAPRPGPTLQDAQPLLSQLLQVMEGGRGDRILNLLDADARSKPSAQALSRQYDSIVDGARPVRVSHVEFKAEPGDGRLLVVGNFRVMAGEQTIGSLGKKMVLRAEFISRDGNVVITGLSGGPVN